MPTGQKIPPQNEDAEKSVLGGILIDKDAINIVSEILDASDFYYHSNELIYEAMLKLSEESKPIDLVTVTTILKKQKNFDKIGSDYLKDLINAVPTAANIDDYAKLVKDASNRRALIHTGGQIVELGFDEAQETSIVIDKSESLIFSISQKTLSRGFRPIKDGLAESFDRIDELHKKGAGLRGIKTGFVDLDSILSGMQKSNLLILAARPGQGKTAMVINIAQYIAVNEKLPVGIFSLEMSQEELVDRLLVGQADVDAWRLKTGNLTENDFTSLSEAMGQLAEAPIFIDDTPGITISEIRTKSRRLHLEHNIGLLIVDYLQLVDPGRKYDSRTQEVSVVSQAMKNLARELKVPVLAVSQLNRSVESRGGDKKPQLSDLRESGAIEQDADVVMFIYRPESDILTPNIQTKISIAKHRNGPMGEIDLLFRGDRIRFYNVEKKRDAAVAA